MPNKPPKVCNGTSTQGEFAGALLLGLELGTAMKRVQRLRGVLALILCLSCLSSFGQIIQSTNLPDTNSVVSTNFTIVARGANGRVWQQVSPLITNQQGQILYQTNAAFTELATGMHHLVNGQWVESTEDIQITTNGGVATNGQHQVAFAANVNSAGAIDLTMPDSQHLQSHVLGLSYYDSSLGSNVLFALLQDSIGQLVASNQVVYSNAFSNISANVRYAYTGVDLNRTSFCCSSRLRRLCSG